MLRNVTQLYQANSPHWVGDGFPVHQVFSHMGEDRGTDPFLMLDYVAPYHFTPNASKPRGVGQHPHKGFETVTIAYQGAVAHRDSTGAGGTIHPGDVQWMTAGAGIIHEEFHSEEFSKRGGNFQMVQLWVNLPAKDKETPPHYQHLPKEEIPVLELNDGLARLRLIAGQYQGTQGAAKTFSEMNVWDCYLNAKQSLRLSLPQTHRLSLLILEGSAQFSGNKKANKAQLVRFDEAGEAFEIQAGDEQLHFLLLSGVPLGEPVVGYGPFVMNTEEQIRQAIYDFNLGRFGQLKPAKQ